MDVEVRQLRCLVAIVDEGTFTDAAIALGVSQAAVSRTLAALERTLGVLLLRRTSRHVTPTATGQRIIDHGRRVLAEIDNLVHAAASERSQLRIGYAWSAVGRYTSLFQRRWAQTHPGIDLHLIRVNSSTAGLAEGTSDLAVLRRNPDAARFDSAVIGLERRLCALAVDDPLARRRALRLGDLTGRTLLIDRRTGTTTAELWPPEVRPQIEYTQDIDDWLTVISTGRCVGVTAESTANQYPRPGIAYRPVRDAEPVAVRLAWWRGDAHPATQAVIEMLTNLYRGGGS